MKRNLCCDKAATFFVWMMCMLCGLAASAQDNASTLTFTKSYTNNQATADDGVVWTIATDGTQGNYRRADQSGGPGINIGNGGYFTYVQFSTSGLRGKKITSIEVKCAVSDTGRDGWLTDTRTSLRATVNGSAFGSTQYLTSTSSTVYTITGNSNLVDGNVVVRLEHSSRPYTIYVHQIIVHYGLPSISSSRIGQSGYFASGYTWQEVGYAGLGNQNEVLAVGEYTATAGEKPTIGFTLLGGQDWEGSPGQTYRDFVSRVCVYARKYNDAVFRSNNQSVSTTFAQIFDYRDPVANSGAILLASTTDIAAAEQALTSDVALEAGNYVIYVTADIKENVDLLPLIDGENKHFTTIGANITQMGTADPIKQLRTVRPNGSRVLVPLRKVIYMPGDFYSRYYRIPSIATAANGDLVCISDARKYHPHDIENDIDMLARISSNNGKTWGNPVTIAKGEGGSATMSTKQCANAVGYGDAALVALPNGDLLATMVNGYRIAGGTNSKPTNNYYYISHDNGRTWARQGQIPKALTNYTRGCIAPGNLCPVKSGPLEGKVLGVYRAVTYGQSATSQSVSSALPNVGSDEQNYILMYDPDTDNWSRINVDYVTNSQTVTNRIALYGSIYGKCDETHITQIDETHFLLSFRYTSTNYRKFAYATYNTSTSRLEVKHLVNCGMNLGTQANGEMIAFNGYLGEDPEDVILHSVPSTLAYHHGGGTHRSGLSVYSVDREVALAGNQFTWTPRLNVSDPFGGINTGTTVTEEDRNETAQYSSFTVQADGTLGLLFEEYPLIVYIPGDDSRGDYLMHSVYMNLRIGDMVPGMTAHKEQLVPPTIAPDSKVYDYRTYKHMPEPIVVSQENEVEVTTYVTFRVMNAAGVTLKTVNTTFTGASASYDADALRGMGILDGDIADGTMIQVSAYCRNTDAQQSTSTSQNYTFKNAELRRYVVLARPTTGWGHPEISAVGPGVKPQGEVLEVSVGSQVTVNAPATDGYTFEGFDLYGRKTYVANDPDYTRLGAVKMNDLGYQIQFTASSTIEAGAVENNYDSDGDGTLDAVAIYAWYQADNCGVKTRVYISRFDSNANTGSGSADVRNWKEFYCEWAPDEKYMHSEFPTTDLGTLDFGSVSVPDNEGEAGGKQVDYGNRYPLGTQPGKSDVLAACGLHLNVSIMPDYKAANNNNAFIMLRKRAGNSGDYSYLTRGEFNKPIAAGGGNGAPRRVQSWDDAPEVTGNESGLAYYLLNGRNYQFAEDGTIKQNAIAQTNWFDNDQNPVLVEDMMFNNLIDEERAAANGYDDSNAPGLVLDVFVVNKNNLGAVEDLTTSGNYVYKVSHYFQPDGLITSVKTVKTASSLRMVPLVGGVMVEADGVQPVTIYNLKGQVVRAARVNGSQFIALPAGPYVAAGTKFVVR